MKQLFLVALLVLGSLLVPIFAMAQTEEVTLADAETLLAKWEAGAAAVDSAIEVSPDALLEDDNRRAEIEEHRTQARALSNQARAKMVPVQEQLDALGPVPAEGETEASEVAEERAKLRQEIEGLKATNSKAELAFTRADSLLERIAVMRRQKFTDRLLTRGPLSLIHI